MRLLARAWFVVLGISLALVISPGITAQDFSILAAVRLPSDSDAWLRYSLVGSLFRWIGNDDIHYVAKNNTQYTVDIWRSYIHFSDFCYRGRVRLYLDFVKVDSPPVKVMVYAIDWDGETPFGFYSEPSAYWKTEITVRRTGWKRVDVTRGVEIAQREGYHIAFKVALEDDTSPGTETAWFQSPYLKFRPCGRLKIWVKGLDDATVTQPVLAAQRYVSMGELTVKVRASVNYKIMACYTVDPEPSPAFTADPFDLAYTWAWFTLPRCPSYTELPGFSGSPGQEEHSYRARVDLADLGDRAAEEEFKFTVHVLAVPQ